MAKRVNPNSDYGGPSRSSKEPRLTEGETATTYVNPTANIQLNNVIHGNLSHVKLLTLFLIRAIHEKYQFKLGGKFNDIIFQYDLKNENNQQQTRHVFLQFKHKLSEEKVKITEDDLLQNNNDFSLSNYFRSYLDLVRHQQNQEIDKIFVICNDFGGTAALENKEIKLIDNSDNNPVFEKLLTFEVRPGVKLPICYRLEKSKDLVEELLKKCSDNYSIAEHLIEEIKLNQTKQPILISSRHKLLKTYQSALAKEKVLDRNTSGFHKHFVQGRKISQNASDLRRIINKLASSNKLKGWTRAKFTFDPKFGKNDPKSIDKLPNSVTENEIDEFLKKLVLVVNTPNEAELNLILKNELSIYCNLMENDLMSYAFFEKMLNLFVKPKEDPWLTPEEGQSILHNINQEMESIRVYAISDDYKQTLKQTAVSFNDDAIKTMTDRLKTILHRPCTRIGRIITDWPAGTAVKVISALESLQEYKCSDSYVMISLGKMKMEGQKKRIHDALSKKEPPNNLLIVVCDDQTEIEKVNNRYLFIDDDGKPHPTKVLVILKYPDQYMEASDISRNDIFLFQHLSYNFKQLLQSMPVIFQETPSRDGEESKKHPTVEEIIGKNHHVGQVIDHLLSVENLINAKQAIVPSFISSTLDSSLYIERRIERSNDRVNKGKLLDKLSEAFRCTTYELAIDLKLSNELDIEWSPNLTETRKSKIWAEIKKLLPHCLNDSQTEKSASITEDELVDGNWKSKVVILTGSRGDGKSTILPSLYKKIKKRNPFFLIVRINFTDFVEVFLNWKITYEVIDCFVEKLPEVKNNPFAQSLIRHRLQTSGGIVLMMDGFDEIHDYRIRDNAIHFMKAIIQTKLDRLYITSSHLFIKEQLQDGFFQFAWTLQNFTEEDQIDYLCKFLQLDISLTPEIKSFAESFIKIPAETLQRKEGSIFRIPFCCNMLAQYFAQLLKEMFSLQSSVNLKANLNKFLEGKILLMKSMHEQRLEQMYQIIKMAKIKYFCNYWETYLKPEIWKDNQVRTEMKSFAESLIKKVSETFKDKEKDFVEDELQCEILADCFALRLKEVFSSPVKFVKQKLQELLQGNLDLLSLYKVYMNKKQQIFIGTFSSSQDYYLKHVTEYLTKLAITVIFPDQKVADILWPPPILITDEEYEKRQKLLVEGALSLGLINQQAEFIHKTVAEYLVAKFLYEGFLLDDKKCNKLLQNYSNFQFFVESILVLDEYDGVRIFFDSMLRETVESEEWHEKVIQKALPQRFLEFACELNRTKEIQNKYGRKYEGKIVRLILETAFEGKYSNIFEFIADCLEVKEPSAARSVRDLFKQFTLSCGDQNQKVIERLY